MRLHKAETVLLPAWLCVPLLTLGVFFVLWWPFGIVGWGTYAIALAVSIATGLFTHRRYETIVLERSTEAVVVRFARRKRVVDLSSAAQP
jgi:predicted RND superfamily exporter protein